MADATVQMALATGLRGADAVYAATDRHFDATLITLDEEQRTRLPADMTALYPGEEWQIYQAVLELETFVLAVRRWLLPVLRERLGISWLFPGRRVRDRNQAMLRKLVAITFPYNLERLRGATLRLKDGLLSYYPRLSEE